MISALKNIFIFSLCLFIIAISSPTIFAQAKDQDVQGVASMGVARIVETKGKNILDGSILSTSPGGAVLSDTPYDSQVLGVVSRDAAMIINTNGSGTGIPVISVGTVYVLVSSQEGPIKKGDYITTSTMPGIGVKAVKSGYVLGIALEDYDNADSKKTGKIAADFSLSYFNSKPTFVGSLSDIMKLALFPTKDGPTPIFKYVVAGIVVIASFVLGFMSFGRTAAKGVEALGRNPAAGKIIHLGIIFNVAIVVVIVFAGLTVSFLILRL